jgi:hypothetical protein
MTNHSSQEQRTKAHFSGILRLKKITEANGIKEAARHNRRELLPELKTSLRIDPSLTYKNEVLCGPSSADEIPRLADELLKKASARVVRKDAVRAIEIIFSLPKNFEIDERAFFRDCIFWIHEWFGSGDNILSAEIHRDESAPHCHVLYLPLINGKLNGGKLLGYKGKLIAMHDSFHRNVGAKYGLNSRKKMSLKDQKLTAKAIFSTLIDNRDPALRSGVWQAIRTAIESNPEQFANELGVPIIYTSPQKRTMAQIFTSAGKGSKFDPRSIDFTSPRNGQSLCSVDFQKQPSQIHAPIFLPENNFRSDRIGLLDPETGEYYDPNDPNKPTSAAE